MAHASNPFFCCGSSKACSYAIGETKGFEYKSRANLFGVPLVHVSFKYIKQAHGWKPVMAKGILAIGQFSAGVISLGQFSVGVLSLSQFSISIVAVAQFAIAHLALAQFAIAHYGQAAIGYITEGLTYFP